MRKPEGTTGERTILRPVRPDDAARLAIWQNDPVVRANALSPDSAATPESVLADIKRALGSDGDWFYIIQERVTG